MYSTRENNDEDQSNVQVETSETTTQTHTHDVLQPGNVDVTIDSDEHDHSEVQANQLLHHKVEGRVDGLVEEVEELENQRAEVVDELVNKMVKEVTEVMKQMEALTKSLNSPRSFAKPASYYHRSSRNVNVNNSRSGCSYKEFLLCNPKDFDEGQVYSRSLIGKALTVVGMTLEDFKALMREEFCPNNEMQKLESEFWCHTMVGAIHAAYTDRFHKLARLVPHLVTPENKRIERNKADLDTMSMDDLYNNLKVYEPEVKGMFSSSSSTHNMAFVSSSNNNTSSTNEAVNTAHRASTASTQVNHQVVSELVKKL
ncbi:hypothetical protein Tco_0145724 [Tanacetum coccineum]